MALRGIYWKVNVSGQIQMRWLKQVTKVTALSVLHFQMIVISLAGSTCQRLHLFVGTEHVSSDCDQVSTRAERKAFLAGKKVVF